MATALPEFQPLLAGLRDAPAPDLTQPVDQLRAAADAGVLGVHALVRPVQVETEDAVMGGVPVRVYRPLATATAASVHVHLHGGGWWMGSIETTDPMARELCAASGMTVVSVGYRLAPEHPWPAAPEDVYAVLQHISSELAPATLSIGGESAGANLAAVVALMTRDRGGPRLAAQWLDVPALDLELPDSPSLRSYGSGHGLDIEPIRTIVGWYVTPDHLRHPYVSPMHADDLTGLPPAIITTAELDPVRDQGEAYARRLETAGVPVHLSCWSGHLHSTMWLTAATESARAWHASCVARLLELHAEQTAVVA